MSDKKRRSIRVLRCRRLSIRAFCIKRLEFLVVLIKRRVFRKAYPVQVEFVDFPNGFVFLCGSPCTKNFSGNFWESFKGAFVANVV